MRTGGFACDKLARVRPLMGLAGAGPCLFFIEQKTESRGRERKKKGGGKRDCEKDR